MVCTEKAALENELNEWKGKHSALERHMLEIHAYCELTRAKNDARAPHSSLRPSPR